MKARPLVIGGAAAIALVTAVVLLARERAGPPARCAPGMIALGPRCCGEGQILDGDRCKHAPIRCAAGMEISPAGCVAKARVIHLEGGLLRVGPGDWEAQGVIAPYEATVAPFDLDALEITEARWIACLAASACPAIPLSGEPGRAVARVTFDEAARFCRWAGGTIPTRDQLAFAAAGKTGRRYAWGDTGAVCRRAAWGLVTGPCAWGATGPELAGSHPDGASPEGALDLAGNVAEWCSAPEGVTGVTGVTDVTDGVTEARGGSFADGAASAIRAWQRRALPRDTRAPDVGFRCAYPPGHPARHPATADPLSPASSPR